MPGLLVYSLEQVPHEQVHRGDLHQDVPSARDDPPVRSHDHRVQVVGLDGDLRPRHLHEDRGGVLVDAVEPVTEDLEHERVELLSGDVEWHVGPFAGHGCSSLRWTLPISSIVATRPSYTTTVVCSDSMNAGPVITAPGRERRPRVHGAVDLAAGEPGASGALLVAPARRWRGRDDLGRGRRDRHRDAHDLDRRVGVGGALADEALISLTELVDEPWHRRGIEDRGVERDVDQVELTQVTQSERRLHDELRATLTRIERCSHLAPGRFLELGAAPRRPPGPGRRGAPAGDHERRSRGTRSQPRRVRRARTPAPAPPPPRRRAPARTDRHIAGPRRRTRRARTGAGRGPRCTVMRRTRSLICSHATSSTPAAARSTDIPSGFATCSSSAPRAASTSSRRSPLSAVT